MASQEQQKRSALRFAVMLDGDGFELAEWQFRCVEETLRVPGVELALLIRNPGVTSSSISLRARLKRARPSLVLGQIYRNLLSRPRMLRRVDASALLRGTNAITCHVTRVGKYCEHFGEEDLRTIRAAGLDFILRFGFNILGGPILSAARFGVWSFHHGDEEKYRGVSEGFWEIMNGDPVAGAILQRLTESLDAGIILRKGHFPVVKHSWTQTRDTLLRESARWPSQVCRDVLNGVDGYLQNQPSRSVGPLYRRPTNGQAVRFGVRVLRNGIVHAFNKCFMQATWGLGVVEAPIQDVLRTGIRAVRHFPSTSRRYEYLADPFGIEDARDGGVTILCERYDFWKGNRGTLVRAKLKRDGLSDVREALTLQAHASYPFLIDEAGVVFCVPETSALNRIELHRAVAFPDQWESVATLVDGFPGVDPTIFRHDNRWWLAATSATDGPDQHLYLWHAESLTGRWTAHAGNPVKCDVRSARPAGTPFVVGDALYRPAQDCSDGYGRRISINRVQVLNPLEFREDVVAVLAPDPTGPFPDGIHTLSSAGNMTLIDGRHDFFDPLKLLKKASASWLARASKTRGQHFG